MKTYLFGQYLLEEGVIDPDQLNEALAYQREKNQVLGALAVEQGLLTEEQVRQILEWQLCEDMEFGDAAVEMELLGEADRDRLVQMQQSSHVYLGDALVALDFIGREEAERQFDRFRAAADEGRTPREHVEDEAGEDTPLAMWSILTRVLPRYTGGRMICGGFYPTIEDPGYGMGFVLGVEGDMDFEVLLMLPDEIQELLGNGPDRPDPSVGGAPGLLKSLLEVFCSQQEEREKAVKPRAEPRRVSGDELRRMRQGSGHSSCVEFYLIQPPAPEGEFHQFHGCLLMGR